VPAAAGLEVSNLAVGYGRKVVVENIFMSCAPGEIAALLGINGAGKSTILKSLVGLLKPAAGSIFLDGRDITGAETAANAARGLVLVPEGARSFHELSVLENLEMGGFVIGEGPRLRSRIEEVLGFFPRLRERLRQRAGVLSGGERQMLAIARALMLRPRVLLLDEPFLGLSPLIIYEVAEKLKRLATDNACGVLVAEQHIGATLEICSKIYVVQDRVLGSLATEGKSEDDIAELIFGAHHAP
jgi:ABC-type branched-subunit amino acid transport system ATPase component